MIDRVIIDGYRCFEHLDFVPNPGMNIIVGENESGKSTLLEALVLALTGRSNGRWASEELNPFWFHRPTVIDFFARRAAGEQVAPPELSIEVYLTCDQDSIQHLRGVHNSRCDDCPGVALRVAPSSDYSVEFDVYLKAGGPKILPVEFYEVDWRDFADQQLVRRPKELATSFIDSRTLRSASGVDYHTREMLSEHLDSRERAQVSLAHRDARQAITDGVLAPINKRLATQNAHLHHRPIGLQMDQSARTSWETGVVPQVDDIPFAMAGQGQQAAIKVSLAMSRTTGSATFVLIEEPETHLSHAGLWRLVERIEALAGTNQQLFLSTHNSFVLNRLGLDALLLLHAGAVSKFSDLPADTVKYFRKLAGYDTLRIVLADKVALVEGPSDAIVLERAFQDATGSLPRAHGIDVISMNGLTFRRALELCAGLKRTAIALRDNDNRSPEELEDELDGLLVAGERDLLVSDPESGPTLEPQLIAANSSQNLGTMLGLRADADVEKWMSNNKTEAALRIADADEKLNYPDYIAKAVALLQ